MTEIETDVLVLGGGPAGIWAALSAAADGARVVVADKGRCAGGGPAVDGIRPLWNTPSGPAREDAVRQALRHSGGLGDPLWMRRVLDETHDRARDLERWGYRFPVSRRAAAPAGARLDGARYLRLLRRRLRLSGVLILDHHPALQLLVDASDAVAGACGVYPGERYRSWTVRAGAVVMATGGCAFRSAAVGTEAATGDGLLMAAEAGARLSGMEFAGAYGIAVAHTAAGPIDRSALALHPVLRTAPLFDESGAALPGHRSAALVALAAGKRVFAEPTGLLSATRERLTRIGLLDATGRIPIRAVLEGTVRGSGGIAQAGPDCAATVPGLYVAGDVADRQAVSGAAGGASGRHAAWAIASGVWAGRGAAARVRERGVPARAFPVPGAGLAARSMVDPRAVIGLVQEHTLPLRRSYLRSAGSLRDSIGELDLIWPGARLDLGGRGPDLVRAREAAAMLAVARWSAHSALVRAESRGLHHRTDHPALSPQWRTRLFVEGLDDILVERERPAAAPSTTRWSPAVRQPDRSGVARPDLTPVDPVPM
ncbi:FAD-dependent oxidoreductase [Nocardia shimofusensis]|uniref:FAD-dependent oxidoreductase n=1 Tax=Nocardia shimofusensis TaxID=228596 RepID=UPI00083289F8|nr:FAD-binding protein [Nocardia shimofusensis]